MQPWYGPSQGGVSLWRPWLLCHRRRMRSPTPFVHVFVVIALELLLVPRGVEERHVLGLLDLINHVLLGLLICLLVVGVDGR